MKDSPPKRVRIIGKNYEIRHVKKVDKAHSFGEHDVAWQLIKVRRNQCFEALRDTTMHEVTHAIEEQMDLGMKERQVHALAAGLLQVLRENPSLVRFLTAKAKKGGRRVR